MGMKVKADHRDDLIKAFQAQEKRKHQLFFGVGLFVIVDAVVFIILLVCAFLLVAIKPQAWHLFLAPALAGGLGAFISIFMIKAAYGMGASNDSEVLPPNYEVMKEAGEDLSVCLSRLEKLEKPFYTNCSE